ncbi:MAG: hypothetical protein JWM35_247, partial [Verrucomicrobia bacterium]|nr:hypothetical protein [Verrucomicrobiota bacterium]
KRAQFEGYQATDPDKSPGFSNRNQVYLLAYLYCAAGHPREAEALVASVPKLSRSEFSEWLWTRLHEEFGFQPPAK